MDRWVRMRAARKGIAVLLLLSLAIWSWSEVAERATDLPSLQNEPVELGAKGEELQEGGALLKIGGSVRSLALTGDALWIATGASVHRYDLEARTLELADRAFQNSGAIERILSHGNVVYLEVQTRDRTSHLTRYDPEKRVLTQVALSEPLGAWQVGGGGLWYVQHKVQSPLFRLGTETWSSNRGKAWPLNSLRSDSSGSSSIPLVDMHAPSSKRDGTKRSESGTFPLPVFIRAYGNSVFVGSRNGDLVQVDVRQGDRRIRMHGSSQDTGLALDLVPFREGFALATERRGVFYLPPAGPPEPLQSALQASVLVASPEGLLASGRQKLVLLDEQDALHEITSPQPLSGSISLVGNLHRVFLGCDAGVFEVQIPTRVLTQIIRAELPTAADAASAEEVETLIRYLASLRPPERRGAYERLLADVREGYDEVFLVGLNEDDPVTLEIVTGYFRTHHPPRAIEPLIEVLLYLQGDARQRDQVAEILATFGSPVIDPITARLSGPTELLEDGGQKGLERILLQVIDQGGASVLNDFLSKAKPAWLLALGKSEAPIDAPAFIDDATFRILTRRLKAGRDAETIEGCLRLLSRYFRHPDLPPSVADAVPAVIPFLDTPFRRWALYALALASDERAAEPCQRVARTDAANRFWAIQAQAMTGSSTATSELIRALEDPKPDIRAVAAFLLRNELAVESAPALRKRLSIEGTEFCTACVEALVSLRDREALSIFEARLASAIREDQRSLLRGLLALGNPGVADRLKGWMAIEYLAPLQFAANRSEPISGRRGSRGGAEGATLGAATSGMITDSITMEVVELAFLVIAVHGGDAGRHFIRSHAPDLPDWGKSAATLAVDLAEARDRDLNALLRQAVFAMEPPRASTRPAASQSPERDSGDVNRVAKHAPIVFLLLPEHLGSTLRHTLAEILTQAPSPRNREEAARALLTKGDSSSIPALIQALSDPYFQNGPFPLYRYPVRDIAARALNRLGVKTVKQADRRIVVGKR